MEPRSGMWVKQKKTGRLGIVSAYGPTWWEAYYVDGGTGDYTYPEHDKLRAIKDQSQTIGAFLENAPFEKRQMLDDIRAGQ
jgi:hypothetical protein